ncbi:MAG: cytochrome c biogenesis protein CcsA, partial [Aeromicrobium sp.]|nr:cytochrome c biogenesis protein CcsA [Burkholderiales bacterium]
LAGNIASEQRDLPPLLRIEKLMFQLLWVAFAMLTATLLSGVFFSEVLFGKAFQVTHKTVFSFLSWFVFGGLLAGRFFAGWRGKLAIRWTLIGFVMLLLSYVGSKFVLEVILKRV